MKTQEWSQHYASILRHSRAANSVVGGGMWPKFKLIQDLIFVLVACKNEKDPLKNEGVRLVSLFLPLCLWKFINMLKGS